MVYSFGVLFVYDHKALLLHPTNGRYNLFMPPKGLQEFSETWYVTACREVYEETRIKITPEEIENDDVFIIKYNNNTGKIVKKVCIFVHYIKSLSEIGLDSLEIPEENLQLEENDVGVFMDVNQINNYCFWRYKDKILELIK
jgi:8-oxo-dGTP pyrophosphatase MutT (NUDIX family)